MKKTLTVNLGGTVFHIDEDAYRLLDNYLSNLKIHFRKEAGADEIIDDIERRISELFAEKLTAGSQVITITDVEEVIARMGKPEDMEAEMIVSRRLAMQPVLRYTAVFTVIRMISYWGVLSAVWLRIWDGM